MKTNRRVFLKGLFAVAALAATPIVYVARKLGWVNVKDFGAIGDGIANDQPAFNAAVAAVADGGTVYIPPGIYRLETIFQRDDITLEDAGPKKTTLTMGHKD